MVDEASSALLSILDKLASSKVVPPDVRGKVSEMNDYCISGHGSKIVDSVSPVLYCLRNRISAVLTSSGKEKEEALNYFSSDAFTSGLRRVSEQIFTGHRYREEAMEIIDVFSRSLTCLVKASQYGDVIFILEAAQTILDLTVDE